MFAEIATAAGFMVFVTVLVLFRSGFFSNRSSIPEIDLPVNAVTDTQFYAEKTAQKRPACKENKLALLTSKITMKCYFPGANREGLFRQKLLKNCQQLIGTAL